MTEGIGTKGRTRIFEDFLGNYVTTVPTTTYSSMGLLGCCAYEAAACSSTVDEPGGVIKITTGATDDYGVAMFVGVFKPNDGGCVMEARFKLASATTTAVYCGFSETLAAQPTMPAEATGANVLTCNGSGSMVGMLFDPDLTTDYWLAVAGDGGIEETVYSAGVGVTADAWDVVRVEISADKGDGSCYLNGKLINKFTSFLTTTDIQYAVLMFEVSAAGGAQTPEVDYF